MITVYSKTNCQNCTKSVLLLELKGVVHEVLKLDVDFTQDDVSVLAQGQRSYPLILVDGVKLGGFEQLKEYLG